MMDEKKKDIAKERVVNLFMELFGDNVVFHFFDGNGKVIDTKIILAVKGPGNYLKEFGIAYGPDLFHCFCLGNELCKDFVRKVFAFKAAPNKGGCGMSVTFYCKKEKNEPNESFGCGLGCSLVMAFTDDCATLKFFVDGEMAGEKKVMRVEKAGEDLKKLGRAFGMDTHHCFYLASKHCKNFEEEVFAYEIGPGKEGFAMSVIFYCKK